MNSFELLYFPQKLIRRMSTTIIFVGVVFLLYVFLMQRIGHTQPWIPYLVVLFATLKALFFTFYTFKQLNRSIRICHSLSQLLWTFGFLVFLIVFSFATDFNCLSAFDSNAFSQTENPIVINYWRRLFDHFYFSLVTFASIGYGDIVPTSVFAKILVVMEIGQSFVLVIFGLSNINNIFNITHK